MGEGVEGAATTGPLPFPPAPQYTVRSLQGSWVVEQPPTHRDFWRLLDALVGQLGDGVAEIRIEERMAHPPHPVDVRVDDPRLRD